MKKSIKTQFLAGMAVCALGVGLVFISNTAKADDHVGYKKVFLRNHCKSDPSYVCRLTDYPPVSF